MKYLFTKWLIDQQLLIQNQLVDSNENGQTTNEVFIDKTVNELTTIIVIKAAYVAIRRTDHIQENMIKKNTVTLRTNDSKSANKYIKKQL